LKQEKLSLNRITKTQNSKNKIRILKRAGIFLLLLIGFFPFIFSFKQQNSSAFKQEFCRNIILRNVKAIITQLEESKEILQSANTKSKKLKNLIRSYHESRKAYKEIEFFIEYYSGFDAKFYINGPLVPKIEMELSSEPILPHGFQVIEEALFDVDKTESLSMGFEVLTKEFDLLREKFIVLEEYYSTINIEENKIQEALKLQVIRIMCFTLNGYDCTINKESITECAYAINGMEQVLLLFKEKAKVDQNINTDYLTLITSLKSCRKQLLKNQNSDTFDRLNFMKDYLNPAYTNLISFFEQVKTEESGLLYAVNFKVKSFFDEKSINKQYFSVYVTDSFKLKEQAELGKFLFFDPILSGNNERACASCHKDNLAFADGLDKSYAFDRVSKLPRNAPTLINAAYQKLFFHDGRSFNIEDQANEVFKNIHEMNSDDKEVVRKLKQSEAYRKLFFDAFKGTQDSKITPYAVLKCLSEFIKTLDSRNSKFDKYLRGDKTQLSQDEVNGYNLFSGKALCGSCHFFPLFNSTVPPMYNDNEFEVIGTPEKINNKNIDPDPGRKNITKSAIHDHAFKTPSIRNIEFTAPYMHNGVYADLDSVLVFYNRGGGAGLGYKVDNQTLPFDSLGLTKKELKDIKKFLFTLSDTTGLPKAPKKLPLFNDPDLDKRKIGGVY